MLSRTLQVGEDTRTIYHDLSAYGIPSQVGRVAFGRDTDGLSVHYKVTILHGHIPFEFPVNRIVFQQIRQVFNIKQVIDPYYFHIVTFGGNSEGQAADTAKAVYSNLCHFYCVLNGSDIRYSN